MDRRFLKRAPESRPILITALAIAVAHVLVIACFQQVVVASNVLQLIAALLPVALSVTIARRKRDPYFRKAWLTLALAFSLWGSAQCYFLNVLVRTHQAPSFPSAADFLWMLFAFPVLLVTVVRRTWNLAEWVTWLDCAQSCLFFGVLCALLFSHPAVLTVTTAYDVQSAALLLACALRFSSTTVGAERTFFRNLGAYLIAYAAFSSIGNRLAASAFNQGHLSDLCWSFPPLLFCVLVVLSRLDYTSRSRRAKQAEAKFPKYLHGLSAAGLSVMSECVALALHTRHEVVGLTMLVAAFLLFVIRTTARESQLTEAHRTLERFAYRDALTGLANRLSLMHELTSILSQTASSTCNIALVYIDLDRFKRVNDSLGHHFGDQVLVTVASMLKRQVGPNDCLARLAGDEFVVILHHIDEAEARAFARRIVNLFHEPIKLEGRLLYLTVSVGTTLSRPKTSAEDLVREADCAMYAAKHGGKNQEQNFDTKIMAKLRASFSLESDLRQALQEGSISTYYQPIYCAADRRIAGFEALSRWHHPTKGLISPNDFIPLAEETGLMMQLGTQVLRESCQQVKEWNERYGTSYFASVNVSVRQFADPQLAEGVLHVVTESGLRPELLKLEITESVLLSGIDAVEPVLIKWRKAGIKIALDDFGTGYSSLSYLLGLPFDLVKIDRSFVRAFHDDPKRKQIIRTIIELAKILEKRVVAEGVEAFQEEYGLQQMGCDLLQGYYFAKPMSADQVVNFIEARSEVKAEVISKRLLSVTPSLHGSH